jgi:Zn-dependent membrane protease YugP
MTPSIMFVSLFFLGTSMLVSLIMKNKFSAYSKIPLMNGMNGKQIAERMLRENGIFDVKVVSHEGFLSDHYNPLQKTVNLSADVYNGTSISAAAVAAHECGHAVQHASAYSWLMMRSRLVPVVQFSSTLVNWILWIGVIMAMRGNTTVLLIGIILMSLTVLFTLITLPVEFDASRRALIWLNNSTVTNSQEYPKAKDALKWAAMTYVVAALAAVVTLLQYILLYLGRRN